MDTEALTDLVATLQGVEGVTVPGGPDTGKLSASLELAQLELPGVLVLPRGHADDRLSGGTWQLQLLCIAPDLGPVRSLEQLAVTHDLLTTVVDPLGDSVFVTVAHPDGGQLPGLSMPYDLLY